MNSTDGPLALVLGLGRFGGGQAAAAHLLRRGFRLRVADRARRDSLATAIGELDAVNSVTTRPMANAAATPIDWRVGDIADSATMLDGVELCVINPAVRPNHPLIDELRARGIACTQEVNLFLDAYPGRVVLVTGTNGKSTAATLIAAGLAHGGHEVELGGNIGRSLLDCQPTWTRDTVAVLEISSAQLARLDTDRHRVEALAVTRVTKDHVDWHGSVHAYRAAKARAFEIADCFVAHLADDDWAESIATDATRLRVRIGDPTAPGEIGVGADGWLRENSDSGSDRLLHASASHLVGDFHRENLGLAAAICRAFGVDREQTALGLTRVRPLRHRLQLLAHRDHKRLYGNAISTELQSTVSALRTIDGPIHWVGGGKSKDGDFRGFAEAVADRVTTAHLFGSSAKPLALELRERAVDVSCYDRLEQALDAAWSNAQEHDSVLFSPGFASFDQYDNFRARAKAFESWIPAAVTGRGCHGR